MALRKVIVSLERSCISSWRRTYFSSSCAPGMEKSGSVSRQRPRSRPTTLRPVSASSFARIVPVRPTPTVTTSTDLSFVAMTLAPFLAGDHHVLRVPVLVHLGDPLLDVGDAHWLRTVGHVVLVYVRRVYSG